MNNLKSFSSWAWIIIVFTCIGSCFLFSTVFGGDCKLLTEDGQNWPKNEYFISVENQYVFTASCRCYYKSPVFKHSHPSSPKYQSIKDGDMPPVTCMEQGEPCSYNTLSELSTDPDTYIERKLINYHLNETTSIVCGNNELNYVPAVVIDIMKNKNKKNDTVPSVTQSSPSQTITVPPSSINIMPTHSWTPSLPSSPAPSSILTLEEELSHSNSPSVAANEDPTCTPADTVTVTVSSYVLTTVTLDPSSIIAENGIIHMKLENERDKFTNISVILGTIVGVMLLVIVIMGVMMITVCKRRQSHIKDYPVGEITTEHPK